MSYPDVHRDFAALNVGCRISGVVSGSGAGRLGLIGFVFLRVAGLDIGVKPWGITGWVGFGFLGIGFVFDFGCRISYPDVHPR